MRTKLVASGLGLAPVKDGISMCIYRTVHMLTCSSVILLHADCSSMKLLTRHCVLIFAVTGIYVMEEVQK